VAKPSSREAVFKLSQNRAVEKKKVVEDARLFHVEQSALALYFSDNYGVSITPAQQRARGE